MEEEAEDTDQSSSIISAATWILSPLCLLAVVLYFSHHFALVHYGTRESPVNIPKQAKVDIIYTSLDAENKFHDQVILYRKNERIRMDCKYNDGTYSAIYDPVTDKYYTVYTDTKEYREGKPLWGNYKRYLADYPPDTIWYWEARELIDDIWCIRYRIKLSQNTSHTSKVWVNPATKLPVQIQAKITTPYGSKYNQQVTLKFTKTEPPDTIFFVPRDFTDMNRRRY